MNDDKVWIIEESGYVVRNNKPVILLFSRNYNDKFETITHEIHGFEPYFYVPYEERHKRILDQIKRIENEVVIDALGREVAEIVTNLPSDVPKIRDEYTFTDMSDILFDKRFLVDTKIKYAYKLVNGWPVPIEVESPINPRIVYFDIEVRAPEGIMPDAINAAYPIVSIQCLDNYTEKIIVFTQSVPVVDEQQIDCGNERNLLKYFCTYLKELNPDIIAAWSGEHYDVPFIINRAMNIHMSLPGFSRYGSSTTRYTPQNIQNNFNSKVPGRAFVDMMDAFKKYNIGMGQRDSNALKSVIADDDLLGDYAFEYEDIGPVIDKVLTNQEYSRFIAYCKNDVIAMKNIDDALNLYMYFENIRFIAGNKIMDSLYNSKIIEMLLMHDGIRPMPRKVYGGIKEDFPGAYVHSPTAGLHEWVCTVDVASMYPNIMWNFDVNPDIDGITVKSMKRIMNLREHYRALKKQGDKNAAVLDSATKAISNSFYGVCGSQAFRLYNVEKAKFVTTMGQTINQFIRDCCIEKNKAVLYADTDSAFVTPVFSEKEAIELETYLNKRLAEWSTENNSKEPFTLKAEKLFSRLMFKFKTSHSKNRNLKLKPGKKAYAGHLVWLEGEHVNKLSFMGIAVRRSDQAAITKTCMEKFLNLLLVDGKQTEAYNYVKTIYNDIINGNISPYQVSMPKSIRKIEYNTDNPHVRGVNYVREHYKYIIPDGVKPRLIYLKRGEICIDEDFDDKQIIDLVDWEKMAEKTIKNKLESYFQSINIYWDFVVKGQKSLNDWF